MRPVVTGLLRVNSSCGAKPLQSRDNCLNLQRTISPAITDIIFCQGRLNGFRAIFRSSPDEYYRELFRVKGFDYPPLNMNKPSYVGHWTNDVVYSRLAPGVLEGLRKKNPVLSSGHIARRHHQYLTHDIGNPALRKHLHAVIALMRVTPKGKWGQFKRLLERAFPKLNTTIPIARDDEGGD